MKTSLIKIESEAKPLILRANQLEIKDDQSLTVATEILSQANVLLKQVTTARKAETDPLKQEVKTLEAKYKPTEQALDAIIASIRADMGTFQTERAKLLKEQEDRIAGRVERGTMKVETAVSKLDELDRPADKVATASGSLSFRPKNTLKIVDDKLIPRDYLVPDEDKILAALEAGNVVPGCVIEVVQVPINRRVY